MQIPSVIKNLVIVVVGVVVLWAVYTYLPQGEDRTNQQNQTENNPLPPPPPPVFEKVDYAKISDNDVRTVFTVFGQEFPLNNLFTEQVLTIYTGSTKTDYVHYSVEYVKPGKTPGSLIRMPREEFDIFVGSVKEFFTQQKYAVSQDDIFESARGDLSQRLGLSKGPIACGTGVSNFEGGSVLICQRQIPISIYNNLVIPIQQDLSTEDRTEIAPRRISGDYARGTMSVVGESRVQNWLAVKSSDKWTKVAEAEWTCELVNQYKIPQEIYETCKS
jgi:hypothetical protein